MEAGHESKIIELADLIGSTLKVEAMRLGASGGIDVDSYSPDQYSLARILILAALEKVKNDFAPSVPGWKKEVRNLSHF